MITSHFEKFIKVFEENHGILKLSQAAKLGIPKHIVYEMFSKGILVKEEKGILSFVNDGTSGQSRSRSGQLVGSKISCLPDIRALFSRIDNPGSSRGPYRPA